MNKQEITILTTWKGIIYEIEDLSIEEYLKMKTELIWNWQDGFFSKKYRKFIKFASLESEEGKTNFIALPEAKQEFKEMSSEERLKFEEFKTDVMKKTFDWRRKRFLKQREKILKDLSKREESFWIETILQKLDKLEALIKKDIKDNC